jgi:hypothetical protein
MMAIFGIGTLFMGNISLHLLYLLGDTRTMGQWAKGEGRTTYNWSWGHWHFQKGRKWHIFGYFVFGGG